MGAVGASGTKQAGTIGDQTLTVESGARIMVPRPLRDASPDGTWYVVPWPVNQPRCLAAFTPEAWEAQQTKLTLAKGSMPEGLRTLIRKALYHRAVELQLDKVGRLCLGQALAARIGLQDAAVVVRIADGFEIYTPEGYARFEKEIEAIPYGALEDLGMT